MSRMMILTEAELRKIVPLDLDAVACVENGLPRAGHIAGGDAADPAPRHSRAPR